MKKIDVDWLYGGAFQPITYVTTPPHCVEKPEGARDLVQIYATEDGHLGSFDEIQEHFGELRGDHIGYVYTLRSRLKAKRYGWMLTDGTTSAELLGPDAESTFDDAAVSLLDARQNPELYGIRVSVRPGPTPVLVKVN